MTIEEEEESKNLVNSRSLKPFQSPTCTLPWWKVVEQLSRRLPGEAVASGVKASAEVPPRASREVDRLTRNSEKCWPTQGAGAGKTPEGERGLLRCPSASLPNQERIGHHLAQDQEIFTG